jgi:hypothetical protein
MIMSTEQAQPNIESVIGKYIELRDAVERETAELKNRLVPMQTAMKTIETYLMDVALKTGQTKFGTQFGTAFIATKTGCNIADKDAYWNYIMQDPNGRRHLLTLSAAKTSVGEHIEKNGTPPPGINWVAMKEIQIRRK